MKLVGALGPSGEMLGRAAQGRNQDPEQGLISCQLPGNQLSGHPTLSSLHAVANFYFSSLTFIMLSFYSRKSSEVPLDESCV